MNTRTTLGAAILAAYIATIGAANWAVAHHGPIPVGFGQVAPAGVAFAGLALTLRNAAQDLAGRIPTVAAMAAGTVLAYAIATPTLAIASAAAFGFSELADFTVYTWLRRRRMLVAYSLAATAGLVVDSVLFVVVAFHTWRYVPGQIIGKAEMTAIALAVIAAVRGVRTRKAAA
ncbi:VUT family protein [Planosporangium thailandense]|uniref:VUT family protein n=1 Tax=Planosporangium thailandense TaxID=765197 RepID=UPI00197B393B|nr:VUT family protein [Planosporangium thailandense]